MKDEARTVAHDRLIDILAPAEFLPDDQMVEVRLSAGTARALLKLAHTAKKIEDSKVIIRWETERHRYQMRLAEALRRRADNALWGEFRLWYWALFFTWLSLEMVQGALS